LFDNLQKLFRYRALIQSLVARDLKARYRGSVLGFFWSFINPLLQLLIFTFVFTYVLPVARGAGLEHYSLFLLCGILPWTWFESSLLESSNVLIAGGNLIRKVLFPAEVLPIVTVLAGLVHFCLGLLVVAAFVIYYRVAVTWSDLLWLPLVIVVQLVFTTGLALLASVLTVHFRDMRDLLTNVMRLWFYGPGIAATGVEPQPVHASRGVVSGDTLHGWSLCRVASPPHGRRGGGGDIFLRLLRVRPVAGYAGGGSVTSRRSQGSGPGAHTEASALTPETALRPEARALRPSR